MIAAAILAGSPGARSLPAPNRARIAPSASAYAASGCATFIDRPPKSVRASGVDPWARQVTGAELQSAIDEFVNEEAGREGTSVVIGPPDVPGAVAPSETKGLEFDAVLVVEPERILADGPRGAADLYVALTRATQRLGVLHCGPLPEVLGGLRVPHLA